MGYDEFKAELENAVRKDERKKFRKKFKTIKKRLIKSAKKFRPFDYGFMLDIIEICLEAMSLYFNNEYLVAYDVEDERNQHELYSGTLKQCYELIRDRDDQNEHEKLKKAFEIMAEYIFGWWD